MWGGLYDLNDLLKLLTYISGTVDIDYDIEELRTSNFVRTFTGLIGTKAY